MIPPTAVGADLRAALVASCFLGAFPPVDLRAVCFVLAIFSFGGGEIKTKITFWAFGTLLNTTLAYLAYLGYEDSSFISAAAADASAFQVTTKSALKVVPAVEPDLGKKDGKNQITRNRNVFLCYVIGATGSGKTALLRNFIQKSFTKSYSPTLKPNSVVNSTQIQGLEKYLVLMELDTNYDHEILQNKKQMGLCDLILYVYDSSDVHSFSYVANIRVSMT